MSTLRVNTIQNATGSGSPAINGLARAWVNFNGTGTVAIRASYNVSSITDNGTGDYTVNFANAMPDANYSLVGTVQGLSDADKTRGGSTLDTSPTTAFTTSSVRIRSMIGASASSDGNTNDNPVICVSIFR